MFSDGRLEIQLAYVDAPVRDGPGLARHIASLRRRAAGGEFSFPGKIIEICSETSREFKSAINYIKHAPLHVGFDTEHKAPLKAGGTVGSVALIQVCADAQRCYLFRLCQFSNGMPDELLNVLADKILIANNVKGDITSLIKTWPAARRLILRHDQTVCTSVLADSMLKIFCKGKGKKHKLEALVMMLFRQTLDKQLGGGGEVGDNGMLRYGGLADWEAGSLPEGSAQYAANDAWAHLRVYQALMDSSLRHEASNYSESVTLVEEPAAAHTDTPPDTLPETPLRRSARTAAAQEAARDAGTSLPTMPGLEHVDVNQLTADEWNVDPLANMDDVNLDEMDKIIFDQLGLGAEPMSQEQMVATFNDQILEASKNCVDAYLRRGQPGRARIPIDIPDNIRSEFHQYAISKGLVSCSDCEKDGGRYTYIRLKDGTEFPNHWETGGLADNTVEFGPKGFDTAYDELRILYDTRHWMANWFQMAHSKDSRLYKYFCTCTSDAVFKLIPESKADVVAHLRERLKHLNLSEKELNDRIKKTPRAYFRARCRYFIPGPDRLILDLTMVYEFFKTMWDPFHTCSFFRGSHAKVFKNQLWYVRKGFLSDPPHLSLYVPGRKIKSTQLQLYRCLRNTGGLEGGHAQLNRLRPTNAKHMGLRGHCNLLNHHDWVQIVEIQKQHGDLPASLGHTELIIWDLLFDVATALGIADKVTPGWKRHVAREPKVRHGDYFFLKAEKQRLQDARAAADTFVIDAAVSAVTADPSANVDGISLNVAAAGQPQRHAANARAGNPAQPPVGVRGPAVVLPPPAGATATESLAASGWSHAAKRTRTETQRMSSVLECVAGPLTPGLADTLLSLRGKDQDNGQLVTGLAHATGRFMRAGQANKAVLNILEEEEIYSGPAGLTAAGRNIHRLRKNLRTDCEPDAEQRGLSTVSSKPAGAGGSARDPIPLPMMLTGQHEDMELTMNPDVTAQQQLHTGPAGGVQGQTEVQNRDEYLQLYNERRKAERAAQRQLENAAAALAGQCMKRRGCTCNECVVERKAKRKAGDADGKRRSRSKTVAAASPSK